MCGIVGKINLNGKPVASDLLWDMLAPLQHRGPDSSRVFTDGRIGLGHARLSIIDLECGQQPMSNEDGTIWIVFNGEIFNYIELRAELLSKGHVFSSRSDTEVLVHLYEEYGEQCVARLNGQWAFAIWDKNQQILLLSRDRLGIRPLFYSENEKSVTWASEIKALLADDQTDTSVDLKALDQIFTFWTSIAPRTICRGVKQIPPGCSLVCKDGKLQLRAYWDMDFSRGRSDADEHSCSDELLELLTDATRIRLRSDVPVGCYLSGGLDSSLVTALTRMLHGGELRTFSTTFNDVGLNENTHQQTVSRSLGTLHEIAHASHDAVTKVFPDVVWHAETPILRSAPAPMYLLSELVHANGFKVVLTGEGADEILGGYDIFKEAKLRRFRARQPNSTLRPLLLRKLYPYLPAIHTQSEAYVRRFFSPSDVADIFDSHRPRWDITSHLKLFFSEAVKSSLVDCKADAELLEMTPPAFTQWDHFERAQYLESKFLLPGYILSSQGDRMAMAHSVEARHPFLDYRVVEFAMRLPAGLKIRALREKYLLKRVARPLLPACIVDRPKQPFRSPDAASFFCGATPEYVHEALSAKAIRDFNIFDPLAVDMLLQKFERGKAIGTKDNMAFIGVLSTQLLLRRFQEQTTGKSDGHDQRRTEAVHCQEFPVQHHRNVCR